MRTFILFFTLMTCIGPAAGMSVLTAGGTQDDLFEAPPDSVSEVTPDSIPPVPDLTLPDEEKKDDRPLEKSPAWAAVRSAVVPGWGQFYTENRLKGVLFAGAQAGLFSLWYAENRAGNRDMDRFHSTQDTTFYLSGVDHRTNADNFLSWAIIVSLASVLDAYIDAHLYRFEEKVRIDDKGAVEVSVRLY